MTLGWSQRAKVLSSHSSNQADPSTRVQTPDNRRKREHISHRISLSPANGRTSSLVRDVARSASWRYLLTVLIGGGERFGLTPFKVDAADPRPHYRRVCFPWERAGTGDHIL